MDLVEIARLAELAASYAARRDGGAGTAGRSAKWAWTRSSTCSWSRLPAAATTMLPAA